MDPGSLYVGTVSLVLYIPIFPSRNAISTSDCLYCCSGADRSSYGNLAIICAYVYLKAQTSWV